MTRPWSSASTDQNLARSLTTCAASQLPDSPLLRWRAFSISAVTACSSAWTWAVRQPPASADSASASASPQGRERRPQPVGQVGDGLALLPDRLPDALGQVIEALGHLAHLRRPVPGGPRVQVAGREPERHPGQLLDRPGHRGQQPVGDGHPEGEQDQGEGGQDEPGLGDAVAELGIADEAPDHDGAALALHRLQDLPAAAVVDGDAAAAPGQPDGVRAAHPRPAARSRPAGTPSRAGPRPTRSAGSRCRAGPPGPRWRPPC